MTAAALESAHLEYLADRLRSVLPERPGLRIGEPESLGEGWETDLYSLRLEYEAKAGTRTEQLVLRLFRGAGHQQRADTEYRTMQRLQQLDFPVPAPIVLVLTPGEQEFSLIAMERIPGSNLRQRLAGAPDGEILMALDRMAALLVRLHQLDWAAVLPPTEPQSTSTVLQEMRESMKATQVSEFAPHLDWLEQHLDPNLVARPALLHNDYHPENLLLREGQLVAIDWSFAAVGDYRMDLAWTVLLVGTMLGERFRQPMLERYQRYSGGAVEHFEYFEALKLGRRMLTLLTWLEGAVPIPVHRITPAALRGDYKVHILNPYRRLLQITGLELPSIERL